MVRWLNMDLIRRLLGCVLVERIYSWNMDSFVERLALSMLWLWFPHFPSAVELPSVRLRYYTRFFIIINYRSIAINILIHWMEFRIIDE